MSEIRVDTISEKTSANGVAIDSVTLKDGQLDLADSKKILLGTSDDLQLYHDGTDSIINNATGTLKVQADTVRFQNAAGNETIFGGTADGAAFLVHNDATKITTTANGVTVTDGILVSGSTPTVTIGDGGAEDTKLLFDGNAQNFYIGIDDSADDLLIGLGSTVGTTPAIAIDENNLVTLPDGHMVIASTAAGDNLTLKSTNAGAEAGPQLVLFRDSASPANNDVIGRMRFEGDDNEGNKTVYAQLTSQIIDKGSSGGEDSTFQIEVFNNGALRDIMTVKGATGGTPEIVLNESSQDVDFRVESDGNANMLFVNGGSNIVGIGADPDLGVGLHIKSGDSGGSAQSTADELVIEGSGDMGIQLLGGSSSDCGICFGDAADSNVGLMTYNHTDNYLRFKVNASEVLRIHSAGEISTGGETAPDVDAGGITINHGANDGLALSFKNSDVSHGMSGATEVDTYGQLQKAGAGDGGFRIMGFCDGTADVMQIMGFSNGAQNTDTTGSGATVELFGAKKSGTGLADLASNENLVAFRQYGGTTRFIMKSDGTVHASDTSWATSLDTYDDAQLCRSMDMLPAESTREGFISDKWTEMVKYNIDDLVDAGIYTKDGKDMIEKGETPFFRVQPLLRLHNGAIWQNYTKHQKLASAFYKLAEKTIGKEEADKLLTEEEIQLLN